MAKNIAIFRINYKSDFILTLNSDAGWAVPFCIKFWTGAPSQAYFVGYDGDTYTHCAPVDGEPTKLRVQFDDHHLPIGDLKFQIGYHFTVADFPTSVEDEVLNQASVIIEVDDAPAQVMLDFNGETAPEIEFSLPAYANEAQRIANEEQRIENEQQRVEAEQTRIANEQTRQLNEQTRVNQEAARVSEYAELKADAVAATRDANDAAVLATQKAGLADDAATLATQKAGLANDAAVLATQKAELADDAATLATQKAGLANDAATLANQKAQYAQDQGDYAKAQGDYAKAQANVIPADVTRTQTDATFVNGNHDPLFSLRQANSSLAGLMTAAGYTKLNDMPSAQEVNAGLAYDVSVLHPTSGANGGSTYASLSAALAVIPQNKQKGGMTVKFVLSSDNKYVQYRLIADEFSTDVEDWEHAASIEDLENGTVIPALANNLASWAGSTQNANYIQEGVVETTGGDLSIDSRVPATLMSIAAKTDFSATKLIATGFNLLRRATAVGNGWYFMVPALPFGTINTASQPNGVLFTNAQGENLSPTVYFKPLSSGVPTSVTDGTACAYTDASTGGKSYRFYTTSHAGYIIVSGIDRATTCAHIGWSKRYDEYIAIDNVNDAGSEVNIAAGIHALHTYDKMLTVGNSADRIERTGDNQVTWHRLVDRVQPTWTTTPVESEGEPTGDYIHTATISGMKSGGAAAFETLDITLVVQGTTISFTDQSSTVENDYVKYELATEATGTAAVSSSFSVEDWGLIVIEGAVGSAYINIAYAQGIPDSVRQMLSNIDNKTIPVIAEALLYLYNENKALRDLLAGKNNAVLPVVKAQSVECDDILTMGVPNVLYSSVAGAPSAANVPNNWDEEAMTVWNGCPRKIGQQYVDNVNKKVYYAVAVTGSTSDWVALN